MRLCEKNKQAGSAGILAVVILALLSVVGAGMVSRTSTEIDMSANYRDGVAAQYLAESGARWGFEYLKTQLADSVARVAILADTNSAAGKTYVNMGQGAAARFGSGATAGTVDVAIKLDPTQPANNAKRVIAATATVGTARRQVLMPVSLPNGGITWASDFAVFAGGALQLAGDNIHVHVGPIGSGGPITGLPKNYDGQMYPNTSVSFPPIPDNLITLANGTIDVSTTLEQQKKYKVAGNAIITKEASVPAAGVLIYATGNIVVESGANLTNTVLYAEGTIIIKDKAHITGAIIAKGSIAIYEETNIQISYDAVAVTNADLPVTAGTVALTPGTWTNH